jgi:hypothetical protein
MQPNALLIWQQNIYDCKKSGVTLIEVQIDATATNGFTGGPILCWLPPCRIFGAEVCAGPTWVWTQCRLDRGSGGCPLNPGCVQPRTRWHRTFLPRSPAALLMARASSHGGMMCH